MSEHLLLVIKHQLSVIIHGNFHRKALLSFDLKGLCGLICIDDFLTIIIENDDALVQAISDSLTFICRHSLFVVFLGYFIDKPTSVISKSDHGDMDHDQGSEVPAQRDKVLQDEEWQFFFLRRAIKT